MVSKLGNNCATTLALVSLFFSTTLYAQESADDIQNDGFEQLIELILEQQEDEGVDAYQLIEELNYLKRHPINLNRCSLQDLEQIPFLLPIHCTAILAHRENTGGFMHALELQGVSGLNAELAKALIPFVTVGFDNQVIRLNWSNVSKEGEHELVTRYQRVIEERKGYIPNQEDTEASPAYLGSPERILIRHRFRVQNLLSAGITMEKDAGEAFSWSKKTKGFDFYSAHLYLRDQGPFKQLAIGDYHAQFGQGLAIWSGQAFNRSTGILGVKRNAQGLLPYAAADENNFLRGIGITTGTKHLQCTVFGSLNRKDASLIESDSIDAQLPTIFQSIQVSGLHATEQQMRQKNTLRHFVAGQHLNYSHKKFQLGFSTVWSAFDGLPMKPAAFYRQYQTINENGLVTAIDFQYARKNLYFFGEQALKSNGAKGSINGVLLSLDKQVDLSIVHRYYDRHFAHVLSNAFGVQTRAENEQGLNIGLQTRLASKWRADAALDFFRFPWLRYRVDGPSEGWSALLQLNYLPSRKVECYLRIRNESRIQNLEVPSQATNYLTRIDRQSLRFHIGYPINPTFSTRTRLEISTYKDGKNQAELGILLYQDFIWTPAFPSRIRLKMRFAFFETDGYNSRIYAYEHDLRYSFSVPAFADQGSRVYAMIDYRLTKRIRLSARLAQTFIHGAKTIGSGLNEIQGATITDIRAQAIFQF